MFQDFNIILIYQAYLYTHQLGKFQKESMFYKLITVNCTLSNKTIYKFINSCGLIV